MKLHFAKLFAKAGSEVGQPFKKCWEYEPRVKPGNPDGEIDCRLEPIHTCLLKANLPVQVFDWQDHNKSLTSWTPGHISP